MTKHDWRFNGVDRASGGSTFKCKRCLGKLLVKEGGYPNESRKIKGMFYPWGFGDPKWKPVMIDCDEEVASQVHDQ